MLNIGEFEAKCEGLIDDASLVATTDGARAFGANCFGAVVTGEITGLGEGFKKRIYSRSRGLGWVVDTPGAGDERGRGFVVNGCLGDGCEVGDGVPNWETELEDCIFRDCRCTTLRKRV